MTQRPPIQLTQNELNKALHTLSRRSEANASYVSLLQANPKEAKEILKRRIARLKDSKRWWDFDQLLDLSCEMDYLLEDIETFAIDGRMGISLLLYYFETDRVIFENCDDDGILCGNYQRAGELLKKFWLQAEKPQDFIPRMQDLIKMDYYGARNVLLQLILDVEEVNDGI